MPTTMEIEGIVVEETIVVIPMLPNNILKAIKTTMVPCQGTTTPTNATLKEMATSQILTPWNYKTSVNPVGCPTLNPFSSMDLKKKCLRWKQ